MPTRSDKTRPVLVLTPEEVRAVRAPVGALLDDQERELTRAFHDAFDLED